MKIFVIDDDHSILESFANNLRQADYIVSTYDNPLLAIEQFKRRTADVIITDYKMSQMDGLQLLKEVKAIDPDVFVILLTGYAELDMAIKAINEGVFSFFEKPFDFKQLLAKLVEIGGLISKKEEFDRRVKELQRDLRQSQKFESLAIFASGIAHDFNNILSPIYGYAELALVHPQTNSEIQEYMREILKAARRAKELIDQIQSFNRAKESTYHVFDIVPIIKETLKLLRAAIPKTIDMPSEKNLINSAYVLGDPTQIHQIVMNLCTNAFHAMESFDTGNLTVTLMLADFVNERPPYLSDIKPDVYAELKVCDSGIGMDKETLKQVFQPFFTTKSPGKGTGLGLYVVQNIVNKMKGRVHIESEKGRGTCVKIYLPIKKQRKSELYTDGEETPRGTERIMLIEDEENIGKVQQKFLQQQGFEVHYFSDSQKAWSLLSTNLEDYKLVITDIRMPHLSGYQIARNLANKKVLLPIIFTSGSQNDSIPVEIANYSPKKFLIKPISLHELAVNVRKILDTPLTV